LGRTGLQVSVLGVGCGYLSVIEREVGERLLARAFELGVNYFDGRYGDSNQKLAPLLACHRHECVVVSKTHETTAAAALHRIEEDCKELGSDYIDLYLLRTYSTEMLRAHLAPGGSMEGLLRAREQGKIRFIGLSGHGDLNALAEGVRSGLVDYVLFPLNIVRREALEQLVPVAQQHDVGLGVMKPVSVGAIPARVALPWLLNQPIHTIAPGVTTLAQLEENVAAVERDPLALSTAEAAEVEAWRQRLETTVCRICDEICGPQCEPKLYISMMVHHDVWYNHYRNMGLAAFLAHPWAAWAKRDLERHFSRRLEALQRWTRCGKCEEVCPYHLPIREMLQRMLQDHPPLLAALREQSWATQYADAVSPYR
jgi:predicted aldo/keto reductase-like oxidoreductase